MMKQLLLSLLLSLIIVPALLAQTDTTATKKKKRWSVSPLPFAYNTPETSWAFGALAVFSFKLPNEPESSRSSQIQPTFVYTLNKQIFFFTDYQLYVKDMDYSIYGKIGYYKFVYDFYGVGIEAPYAFTGAKIDSLLNLPLNMIQDTAVADLKETYYVNYPRFRLNALKRIKKTEQGSGLYAGLRYYYEDYNVLEDKLDTDKLLIQDKFLGSYGYRMSGLGLVINYDTRDNFNFAYTGSFVEAVAFFNNKALGGTFNYSRYTVDYRQYFTITPKHYLIGNAFFDFTGGNVPFNELPRLGGSSRMRGYYDGRYMDNNAIIFQAEYRFIPFFWRLGATVFASYGGVADKLGDFSGRNFKYAVGGGLRIIFNKNERINLRIDYAIGQDSKGFYMQIGEAF